MPIILAALRRNFIMQHCSYLSFASIRPWSIIFNRLHRLSPYPSQVDGKSHIEHCSLSC